MRLSFRICIDGKMKFVVPSSVCVDTLSLSQGKNTGGIKKGIPRDRLPLCFCGTSILYLILLDPQQYGIPAMGIWVPQNSLHFSRISSDLPMTSGGFPGTARSACGGSSFPGMGPGARRVGDGWLRKWVYEKKKRRLMGLTMVIKYGTNYGD